MATLCLAPSRADWARQVSSSARSPEVSARSALVLRSPLIATVSVFKDVGPVSSEPRATSAKCCAASDRADSAEVAISATGCLPKA